VDIAEDGTVRARTLYTATVYDIRLIHSGITASQRNAIFSHYAANVGEEFSYTWPDGTRAHTVVYAQAPQDIPLGRGDVYRVDVYLIGTED